MTIPAPSPPTHTKKYLHNLFEFLTFLVLLNQFGLKFVVVLACFEVLELKKVSKALKNLGSKSLQKAFVFFLKQKCLQLFTYFLRIILVLSYLWGSFVQKLRILLDLCEGLDFKVLLVPCFSPITLIFTEHDNRVLNHVYITNPAPPKEKYLQIQIPLLSHAVFISASSFSYFWIQILGHFWPESAQFQFSFFNINIFTKTQHIFVKFFGFPIFANYLNV